MLGGGVLGGVAAGFWVVSKGLGVGVMLCWLLGIAL